MPSFPLCSVWYMMKIPFFLPFHFYSSSLAFFPLVLCAIVHSNFLWDSSIRLALLPSKPFARYTIQWLYEVLILFVFIHLLFFLSILFQFQFSFVCISFATGNFHGGRRETNGFDFSFPFVCVCSTRLSGYHEQW